MLCSTLQEQRRSQRLCVFCIKVSRSYSSPPTLSGLALSKGVIRVRFIIGKEEIPSHGAAAEHSSSRAPERTPPCALEVGDEAEKPEVGRIGLQAYTKKLLESM